MEIYNKAISSNKNTQTNAKVQKGRFRINDTGKIEILADYSTYNKTSKQLLNEKWKVKV